jgi:hypothetical protein
MQEVRWDKVGTVRARDIFFSIGKEMKIVSWEQEYLHTTE